MIEASKPGWQGPPLPPSQVCSHASVSIASAFGAFRYPEGTEYVCGCGKVFVVVSNGGRDKKLVPKHGK